MNRHLTRLGNRLGVWLYRKSGGRIGGGDQVMVMTAPGRRTGVPRSTCVRYLKTEEGLVVWGTGSGSVKVPDWFQNMRHAGSVTVQITTGIREMQVCELQGAERDSVWQDVVLAQLPGIKRFADMADRTIPVVILK